MVLAFAAVVVGCHALDVDFGRGAGAFCEGDAACDVGLFCDRADRRCKPFTSLGAGCSTHGECGAGRCVQGVCCNGPCDRDCLSCILPGEEGICSVVPEGTDPHGHCAGTAQCGGLGLCQGSSLWLETVGDDGDQLATAVSAVPSGAGGLAAVAAGTFEGAPALGPESVPPAEAGADMFVLGFDADGVIRWRLLAPADGEVAVEDVAVAGDRIYVAGSYLGALDGFAPSLDREGFVLALAADGSVIWARSIGGPDEQHVAAIAADDERLYAVGHHRGALVVDGLAPPIGGGEDAFVAALDPAAGTLTSLGSFGDLRDQRAVGVAAGAPKEAIVVLHGEGAVDFGESALEDGDPTDRDAWVAKLAMGFSFPVRQWDLLIGGQAADQTLSDVAVDGQGNAWVVGTTDGDVDISLSVNHREGRDGFIVRLDGDSGNPALTRELTGLFDDVPHSVAVNEAGEVMVAGSFEVDLQLWDEDSIEGGGGADLFFVKLSTAGELSWAIPYGGPLTDAVLAVSLDELGDVYAVGRYEQRLIIGGGSFDALGGADGFVMKLAR